MKNFKEIKTTIIGFVLWIIAGLYFGLPYFSEKDLWETNNIWVTGMVLGGFLCMLAPDRFLDFLFGWLKKKSEQ